MRGSEAFLVTADVTNREDADSAIKRTVDHFGRLDVIINAVGGGAGTALYPAQDYPEAEFDRIVVPAGMVGTARRDLGLDDAT